MADSGTQITGGCICGNIRFRSTMPPIATRYCWCRDCQHFAAGNATVNVIFPSASVTITGQAKAYESTADSGARMRRSFCPNCGTPLFSQAEPRPHMLIIRAGALDDPNVADPSSAIWVSSAPGWACIDPDVEHIPGQPA